jgi:hypothetical protein
MSPLETHVDWRRAPTRLRFLAMIAKKATEKVFRFTHHFHRRPLHPVLMIRSNLPSPKLCRFQRLLHMYMGRSYPQEIVGLFRGSRPRWHHVQYEYIDERTDSVVCGQHPGCGSKQTTPFSGPDLCCRQSDTSGLAISGLCNSFAF